MTVRTPKRSRVERSQFPFLPFWLVPPMDAASQRKGMFQENSRSSFFGLIDMDRGWKDTLRRGRSEDQCDCSFLTVPGPWTPGHLHLHLHSHITIPSYCHSSTTRGWRQGLRTTTFLTSRRVEKRWCGCKNIPNRLFNLITMVFFLDR